MIKKFYNSGDARLIKEQSSLMFEEISDGIYLVVKDRFDKYKEFVTSQQVIDELNNMYKVAVTSRGCGSGYTNFNFGK